MKIGAIVFILWPENEEKQAFPCHRMKGRSYFFILWLEDIFGGLPAGGLLEEGEEDGQDQADEGGEVVPVQGFALEEEGDDQGEYGERDGLLDHFELHEVERAAVSGVADAVGRDGEAVLEECYAPGEEYDQD